jgi:DNA mismatch endonuclease (patch repair protein)
MLGNRSRDTKPELAVRRLIHAAGLRYRVDYAPLRDRLRLRADIVFTRAKVAVFVDGCFWHGCPEHHTVAKTNAEFWATKVTGNRDRDSRTNSTLRDAGWTVLRFWEHEAPVAVAAAVVDVVQARRSAPSPGAVSPRL